jgi:hypothetical protein
MESRAVSLREWLVVALTIAGIFGADKLKAWFADLTPALHWLIAPVTLPWPVLIMSGFVVMYAAFRVGARSVSRRLASPIVQPVKRAASSTSISQSSARQIRGIYTPTELETDIVRVLRWGDEWMGPDRVRKSLEGDEKEASVIELDLALERLQSEKWIERQRKHSRSIQGGYFVYRLARAGMDFSIARKFPHSRNKT